MDRTQYNEPSPKIREGCFYLFKDIDYNGTQVITRPILVIKSLNDNNAFLGLKCTTMDRPYDSYSYKLEDWRDAKLKSPSSVRCDKPLFLPKENLLLTSDGRYLKLGQASSRDMIAIAKTYDKFCDELKSLSEQLLNSVDKTRVYFVNKKSTYASGEASEDMKIHSDYAAAKESFAKSQPRKETVMANGKLQNKTIEYELGYVSVDGNGNYDEKKDVVVTERKRYSENNKQEQKQRRHI